MELSNSIQIPQIGLGVYKMEAGNEMNNAIGAAWDAGYRLFDTAQMYRNEAALGDALKVNQIPRDEIFLISKVDNSNQWYQPTLDSLQESLKKLQTSYLDSFLIHWPGQNKERMLSTWQAMEHALEQGLVRSIGVCNFEVSQLEFLLDHCKIAPMINQIEHNPLMHDEALLSFCNKHSIQVIAWAPLLRGNFGTDTIPKLAAKYDKTEAQDKIIAQRVSMVNAITIAPKTTNGERSSRRRHMFTPVCTWLMSLFMRVMSVEVPTVSSSV